MRTKTRSIIDDDENDPNIARDGEHVRCPMHLMDAMQRSIYDACIGHRPGYAQMTDAQRSRRAEARDSYIERTSNAWRTARDQTPEPDDPDDDDEDNGDSPARRAYLDRLKNASDTHRVCWFRWPHQRRGPSE